MSDRCQAMTARGAPCRMAAESDSYLCRVHALPSIAHLPTDIESIVIMERLRTGADRDKVALGGKKETAWMPARLTDRIRACVRAEKLSAKLTAHDRLEYEPWIGTTASRVAWLAAVERGDVCDYRNSNHGVKEIPAQGRDRVSAGNAFSDLAPVADVAAPLPHVIRAKVDYIYSAIDDDEYYEACGDEPSPLLSSMRDWLRPYQCAWILDRSRFRIARKSRQIGWTDVGIGMEAVGTSSGLFEYAGWDVKAHNSLVISRNRDCAKGAVEDASRWVDWFAEDPDFAYFMGTSVRNTERIEFERSRWSIKAESRSANAGVSYTGHVYMDEFAVWGIVMQEPIFRVAMPMISSDPGLRASVVSTTRGTAEMFYELWTDEAKYRDWSRHFVDVYEAIRQGFPLDPEEARRNFCRTDEDWAQEFEAKFIGTGPEYLSRELVSGRMAPAPTSELIVRNCGIDVASERDLTAVVPVERRSDGTWWRQVYIVQGLPYLSDDARGIIGQDRVVGALLEVIDAATSIMDISGDGGVLFGAMQPKMNGDRKLVGHSFHRSGMKWKNTWVPNVRGAFESGSLTIENVPALEFSMAAALPLIVGNKIIDAAMFVETAFISRGYPQLLMDCLKVHRKQLKSGMSFDTTRDAKHGHGDSFWAAVVGHSITHVAAPERYTQPEEENLGGMWSESDMDFGL